MLLRKTHLTALIGGLALALSAFAAGRPAVGDPAPALSLTATDGPTQELAALRGTSRAVVVFFRGSW